MRNKINRLYSGAIEIVSEVIDVSPEEVGVNTSLKDEFDVDSTEMVDIVVGLEKKFGIRIAHGEQEEFNTISDIVKALEKLVQSEGV